MIFTMITQIPSNIQDKNSDKINKPIILSNSTFNSDRNQNIAAVTNEIREKNLKILLIIDVALTADRKKTEGMREKWGCKRLCGCTDRSTQCGIMFPTNHEITC